MLQNYPNPFNPSTTITYTIPLTSKNDLVQLKVYDLLGREIQNLVNEYKSPGEYVINFDGVNFSSGIYYYQIKSGEFISTKKMILLK